MDSKLRVVVFFALALTVAAGFAISGWGDASGPIPVADGAPDAVDPADTQRGKAQQAPETDEDRKIVGGARRQPTATQEDGLVELRGRFVFAGGAPLIAAGVRFQKLQLLPMTRRLKGEMKPQFIRTETDDHGAFVLRVPPDKDGSLRVSSDDAVVKTGGRSGSLIVSVGAGDQDLGDIEVVRPASITGQVVAGGRAVEGIEISFGHGPVSVGTLMGVPRTKTNAEGRFTIRGLVPGKVVLATRSPEFLPARQTVELVAGQAVSDLLIELRQGGVLTGTVLDDLDRPIEGARVVAARSRKLAAGMQYSGFAPGESTTTDASGRFRLGGLENPKVRVRSTKKGYAAGDVNDAPVGQAEVVIRMKRLGQVTGILVDEAGAPIAGSTVTVRPVRRTGFIFGGGQAVQTDAEGRFLLDAAPPGTGRVVAKGKGHLDAEEEIEVRPGEKTEGVRLQAKRGATLTVTVVDAVGKPVAGAEVVASSADVNDGTFRIASPAGTDRRVRRVSRNIRRRRGPGGADVHTILGDGGELGTAETDAAGVAVIKGLPAGKVEVKAKHPELALIEPGSAELPDGGEVAARLRMQRGGTLAAAIVGTDGKPLANAAFAIVGPIVGTEDDAEREAHKANDMGLARVGPLSPGAYKAVLERNDVVRNIGGGMRFSVAGDTSEYKDSIVPFTVKAGELTEIRMEMPVLTTVSGTVSDAEGFVAGVEVEMVAEGKVRVPMMGGAHKATTDAEGRYKLDGLASGNYTLTWGRRGVHVASEKEVLLQKNQPGLSENLTLPGAVVSLQVKDHMEGFGVEEAKVSLRRYTPPDPNAGAQRRPRRFMMVSVRTTSDGSGSGGPSTFSMTSGQEAVETDERGRAVIKDMPAGKFTLTIEHGDYAKVTKIIDLVQNQHKDLGVIKVSPGCTIRGRVNLAEPGMLNMAMVELSGPSGGDPTTTISRNGSFKFTSLKAGTYKLRARSLTGQANDWGPAKTAHVKPGRMDRITLEAPASK